MAWAHVQSAAYSDHSGTTHASISQAFPATVGNGDLVCGIITYASAATGGISSITDDKGNQYTVVDAAANSSDLQSTASFYRDGITNAPKTITVTFNANYGYISLMLDEFSGSAGGASLDGHAIQVQTGIGTGANAVSSGNLTTTVNGDLIYGATREMTGSGATANAGTGFTLGQHSTQGSSTDATEYEVQTTAGAIAATFTASGGYAATSSAHYCTIGMAFRSASAPPPPSASAIGLFFTVMP